MATYKYKNSHYNRQIIHDNNDDYLFKIPKRISKSTIIRNQRKSCKVINSEEESPISSFEYCQSSSNCVYSAKYKVLV